MPNRTNFHVQRLHRFLPFDPSHEQIYEEYQKSEDSLELETEALNYLLTILPKAPRLVVLTGDAGHGKTHLCRRLIDTEQAPPKNSN
jgi:type II secretory pathway predicted ATPase ExeA